MRKYIYIYIYIKPHLVSEVYVWNNLLLLFILCTLFISVFAVVPFVIHSKTLIRYSPRYTKTKI